MRILIVSSTMGLGGAERAAANAARILSSGHEVNVFTFHRRVDYDPNAPIESLDIPYTIDVPIHRKVGRFVAKVRGLRAAIARHRPQLLLTFGDSASLICLANKAISGGPMVVTNTQAPPSRVYEGAVRPIYLGLIRTLFPTADRSVALSSGVRQELVDAFGVSADKATVVYNTVNLDEARRLEDDGRDELTAMMESEPCVLNVGRLVPQKNQALLVRAFGALRSRTPAKLIIVGEGPLEGQLRTLVSQLGLAADVVFAGWQPNPFRLMKRARAFVLSSDYEGFGNVLVEAMAVGCPVISTDCDFGPAELLQGPAAGLLVPVGDETGLADAMARVLADSALRLTLSQRGRARAEDFSLAAVTRAYDDLVAGLAPATGETRTTPTPAGSAPTPHGRPHAA